MNNKTTKNKLTLALDESGATAVIIAIVLTALSGFVALAFDIGHMLMVKAELQRTADAAALAGVTGLLPYNNPGPNAMPNWAAGQAKAHTIINNPANKADNQTFTITDGAVAGGYWLLTPPADYVQTLPTVRPVTAAYLPEPAIKVTLSRNVPLYLAPLVGVSSPKLVGATATAILPEVYGVTGVPPIAVDIDTVYNIGAGGALTIDFSQQDIKPQSNKGIAGWINLSGDNSVPSVRFAAPLFAGTTVGTGTPVYFTPGTEATLMGQLVQAGETVLLPVVSDVANKVWREIRTWSAFKVESKDANSMTGHFVDIGYYPNQKPDERPAGLNPPFIWGTPKLVGP